MRKEAKATKRNYREFYKRYYDIEFGRDYAVHHIDSDRDNNEIENLVLLPTRLHAQHHFYSSILESLFNSDGKDGNGLFLIASRKSDHVNSHSLKKIAQIAIELTKWIDLKKEQDMAIFWARESKEKGFNFYRDALERDSKGVF